MDFDFTPILEFLYEHAGEMVLGLEFFLVTVLGKVLGKKTTQSTKTLSVSKKTKMIAKKNKQAQKLLSKATTLTDEIKEIEKDGE